MNKRDILEIKRRFTKNGCTFTRMSGCYINSQKEIVFTMNETFLNLEDEEFYKYLEIAKKTLSGTLGNNLLELKFPMSAEEPGQPQQFLLGLRESRLKNEDLLARFYEQIIANYDYSGNYLILLFHDSYDVMTKTSDNLKLDESEEVYEYLLCAICPVELSKPGLGYNKDENKIAPRIRDWVVQAPDTGFIFPAFTERSADVHAVLHYIKDAKAPQPAFMEAGLGCIPSKTIFEKKEVFNGIIKTAIAKANIDEDSEEILLKLQENLNDMVEMQKAEDEKDSEPIPLTNETIHTVLNEIKIPDAIIETVEKEYKEEFKDDTLTAENIIDSKLIAANAQKRVERELRNEVLSLKQKLSEDVKSDCTIVLKCNPDKADSIKTDYIEGTKCLIIPLEEDETANINGEIFEDY